MTPEFIIERDQDRCIACQVCVRQCANDVHSYDVDDDWVYSAEHSCVGCHRCVTLCPTHALTIRRTPLDFRANANWTAQRLTDIYKQAETGGILLTGMGCDQSQRIACPSMGSTDKGATVFGNYSVHGGRWCS